LNQICQPGRLNFGGTNWHCYTLAVFQNPINITYAGNVISHLFDGKPGMLYSAFDGIGPGQQGVSYLT